MLRYSRKSSVAAENRLLQMMMQFEQLHTLSSADLALQNPGAIAAAEYGRLAEWADSPLVSGLGAAFAAARWCISAGAPPRRLACLMLRLYVHVRIQQTKNSAQLLPV